MRIDKKFKLENVASNDKTREVIQNIYIFNDGKIKACATNGKVLAIVPVVVDDNELEKGNSIKASDLKFQRSNPSIKKQDDVFCFLKPLDGDFPKLDEVFPKEKPIVEIGIDTTLLMNLSKALGTEVLKMSIISGDKAIKVESINNNEAYGLIMPCRL